MNFKEHEEKRLSILTALEDLVRFVRTDADFRGNKAYHEKAIGYQHQIMQDGKYRVVFLGTFNVGKSTAINAVLGGAYLPVDIEECTSKLTFIERGEPLQLVITLNEAASADELASLSHLFGEIPATVQSEREGRILRITYVSDNPEFMRQSLEPLVTVMADEQFPHLAPLREKIEELKLLLPSNVLEEDIILVDTPGVHTISETRQEITYGIIEHSHLVIVFVDSGFAGNIHDLNFIKRIMTWRGRRVFFVLNKADKLENDEIDVRAGRGPAHSLIEAFKRHEIPEDAEIFFLSGYRALRAQQLNQGQISLDELLADNRASIPTSIATRIRQSDDPARDLSAYLMGQSRLPHLKERLLDFLLNENKASAMVQTAARFVWERADSFATPLDNELKVAKDPRRFDELRANRERVMARLEEIRATAEQVLARYRARSRGGVIDGEKYPGYETQFRDAVTEPIIEEEVVQPVAAWLREEGNLKEARGNKFSTLSARIEHQVDEFISSVMARMNATIEATEDDARRAIAEQLGHVRELRVNMTEPGAFDIGAMGASMAASYLSFGAGGAVLGAAAGAAIGTSVVPVIGTAIGAGLGGLLGALGGLLARLAWSEERWLRKLEPVIRENVLNMLIRGGKNQEGRAAPPIMDSVIDYLKRRAQAFQDAIQEELDNAIRAVQQECDDLLAREEEIRRECEAIIARLEPKVEALHGLRAQAEAFIRELTETPAN